MTLASSSSPLFDLASLLGPRGALFLDFDGTLVELAPQPDAVRVAPGLPALLGALAQRLEGALALVSGRSIATLDDFLQPLALPTAGVHGSERRRADGGLVQLPAPSLALVKQAIEPLLRRHPALRLESKRGALALHYRQAPELEPDCRAAMQQAVALSPGLSLLQGKLVVEAKSIEASKGLAIEAFLQEPPFAGRRPVFVGDDTTDEAGFAVVQRHGGQGLKIGDGATLAAYRLGAPSLLREALAAWLQQSGPRSSPNPGAQ